MSGQTKGRISDPRTTEEWQLAVDAAEGSLALDAAHRFGCVAGLGRVNVPRCRSILMMGAARGIHPSPNAIERFLVGMMVASGSAKNRIKIPETPAEE